MFLIAGDSDSISRETQHILDDLNNQIYTSAIVVAELLQLYRIGRIRIPCYKTAAEIVQAIEKNLFIKILPFSREHTLTLSKLEAAKGHNDPFDHAIIAHAITERLTLVSSDKQFEHYTQQKLKFAFNKR